MLENLKEKAGELKSKEMELVEREKAVSRRQASIHQILECKECKRCKPCHQIIQREVILFLGEFCFVEIGCFLFDKEFLEKYQKCAFSYVLFSEST